MRTLRFKILAVAAALVLLSQLGTVTAVLYTARDDVAKRATESLQSAATVVGDATLSQTRQFESTVTALAADYGFKQAVATGDTATLVSALNNHAQRAAADIALLFDTNRQITATTLSDNLAGEQSDRIFAALGTGVTSRTVVVHDRVAYEVITVPVRAPLPIAWLTMGFALSDDYAQSLKALTGQNVSFLIDDNDAPLVAASTAAPEIAASLAGFAAQGESRLDMQNAPATAELTNGRHLILKRPLIKNQDYVWVVLSQSLEEAMAPYRILQTAAIALGALPLIAALLGAVLLSRTLTRPIQTLMQAVRRIQAGDYSTPVNTRTGDELNQFAVAFNSMQEEIAQREQRITYQARHDSVTGLYNRDYALELLDQLLSETPADGRLALSIVNLNAADEITGTLGHEIADAYLQQASRQISLIIDSKHVLAHVKTDTFMILLQDCGATDARRLAEELISRLKAGIQLPDVNIAVNPTVGIAVYPQHGDNRETLLRRATIAIEAKEELRRPVRLYREGDEEQRIRNLSLLADFRRAIDGGELQLHYQPKILLADETICGAEALVRWEHPVYGWLTPDKFVPIVEQSGNISLLTHWALRAAALQYRAWREAGLDLSIAVNFSAQDIQDENLPWDVMDALREGDMPAAKLVAEITEEAMVRDFGNAITVLRRLRDLGIPIAIDDFGTGYSSLSQLKKLPVTELKIDRSFVAQLPGDQSDVAIVSASVELAKKLGLSIVAEGVENGAVFRWLREQAVEQGQGYYWSPPLSGADFVQWATDFSGGSTRETPVLKFVD